jgi:hypothetical protein
MTSIASHFGGESELVFWAFRYFLGRQTIHTVVFARQLAEAWPLLEKKDQDMIRKELDATFARDDKIRRSPYSEVYQLPLGRDCDREAWLLVRDAYQK